MKKKTVAYFKPLLDGAYGLSDIGTACGITQLTGVELWAKVYGEYKANTITGALRPSDLAAGQILDMDGVWHTVEATARDAVGRVSDLSNYRRFNGAESSRRLALKQYQIHNLDRLDRVSASEHSKSPEEQFVDLVGRL